MVENLKKNLSAKESTGRMITNNFPSKKEKINLVNEILKAKKGNKNDELKLLKTKKNRSLN